MEANNNAEKTGGGGVLVVGGGGVGRFGGEGPQPSVNKKKKSSFFQHVFINSGALQSSLVNFLLAYNIRAGVSILMRILNMARKLDKKVFSISAILDHKHLNFVEEAVRMGLFLGGFSGIYRATNALLDYGKESAATSAAQNWWHSFVAGTFAGTSLLFMDPSWHRTLALYMATRAAQCMYNFSKSRGYFHFWGSHWSHGDSLLFTLSSAQVMYAYAMRPETLPGSYYRFIRTQGPLDEIVLQAVRDNNRGVPVKVEELMEYVKKRGGQEAFDAVRPYFTLADGSWNPFPRIIPARVMHPYTKWGTLHSAKAWFGVARQIFPVYLSLAFVPAVVLRFRTFSSEPFTVLRKSVESAIQSTIFLATFCGGYQALVLIQRFFTEVFQTKDHKLTYYISGIICSLSILIEKKSRRSELALYAFPRAADSLYQILNHHKILAPLPQGELLLFMLSMGFCMFFYEHDRNSMSPMVSKVLERFLPTPEVLEGMRRNQSYGFFDLRSSSSSKTTNKAITAAENATNNNSDDDNESENGNSKA